MKSTDETITAVIGIRNNADKLTPMDKGECTLCIKEYAKEIKPMFDKMLTHVQDDLTKGLFMTEFELFLNGKGAKK